MTLHFKRYFFWFFLVTLSLTNGLFINGFSSNNGVFAQTANKKPNVKSPPFMRELKLTDSQQKKIMTIRNKYRNSIEQRRDALKTTEEELHKLMSSSASVDTIQVKHSEFQRLNQELEDLRFNSILEIREVLTPSQRAQIAQIINKHREKFRQMMNRPPEF